MAKKMTETPQLLALRRKREELELRRQDALRTVESITGELRGIDHAIQVVSNLVSLGVDEVPRPIAAHTAALGDHPRRARGEIKRVVLEIMEERGAEGLRTMDVVEHGKAYGITLDRNSVASLLSRLTAEGVMLYDRESGRYRSKQPAPLALRTVA